MIYILIAALALLYIAVMIFAGRAHGAGKTDANNLPTGYPSWGREGSMVMFGLSSAAASYALFGLWWLAIISAAVTIFGFNTGHGRFYAMLGANTNDPKPEWIEKYIASWAYRGDITKPAYSWFCMAVKGLLVGFGAGPFALLLAFLWPLCYYISWEWTHDSAPAEYGVGGATAAVTILAVLSGVFLIGILF